MMPEKMSKTTGKLRVRNLSKRYGYRAGRKMKTTVFENISFDVSPGEIFGIMGPSGAGKTTLAKILLGIVPANSGEAWMGAMNILRLRGKALAAYRRQVQPITQQPETALNPRMTIRESLREVFRVTGKSIPGKKDDARLLDMLYAVGLGRTHLSRYPRQLSGGELQRVVIARVMALKPRWVIADEPTANLDIISQARVIRLILARLRQIGSGLILISHDADLIGAICDRVYHLNEANQ